MRRVCTRTALERFEQTESQVELKPDECEPGSRMQRVCTGGGRCGEHARCTGTLRAISQALPPSSSAAAAHASSLRGTTFLLFVSTPLFSPRTSSTCSSSPTPRYACSGVVTPLNQSLHENGDRRHGSLIAPLGTGSGRRAAQNELRRWGGHPWTGVVLAFSQLLII